jgi:hypothetical protein
VHVLYWKHSRGQHGVGQKWQMVLLYMLQYWYLVTQVWYYSCRTFCLQPIINNNKST